MLLKRCKRAVALLCIQLMAISIMSSSFAVDWTYFDPAKVIDTGNGIYVSEDLLEATVQGDTESLNVPVGGMESLKVGTNPGQVDVGISCIGCLGGFEYNGGCYSECPGKFGYCVCSGTTGKLLTPTVQVVKPSGYVEGVASAEIKDGELRITGLAPGKTTVGVQGVLCNQVHSNKYYDYRYTQVKTITVTVKDTPPAPAELSAAVEKDGTVTLDWDTVDGATSYNVYMGKEAGKYDEAAIATITGDTLYRVTNLARGETYYFTVTSSNDVGEGAGAAEVSTTISPPAPGEIRAVGGNTFIRLSWSASAGAAGYRVYQRNSLSGGYGDETAVIETEGMECVVKGLVNDTIYYFAVTALNAGGESEKSAEVSAAPVAAAPASPAGLRAVTDGVTISVSLNWNETPGATGYKVYLGTSSGSYGAEPVAEITGATAYRVTGLVNRQTYYFAVTAVNESGESGYSNEVSVTPVVELPSVPGALSVIAGNGAATLNWKASTGAADYKIYMRTEMGNYGTEPVAMVKNSTIYTVTGLNNGTDYCFAVAAVNAGGDSALSAEVSATPSDDGNWIEHAAGSFAEGDGSKEHPYIIGTAEELAYLARQVIAGNNYWGSFFKLTADIDLQQHEWTPVGDFNTGKVFWGTLDGDGHTVKNLRIDNPDTSYQGLISLLYIGTVENLGVENFNIKGKDYVGGIAGKNTGNIGECYATGCITGGNYVGGISGSNELPGKISECYAVVAVTGTGTGSKTYIGGLAGYNRSTSITNCYVTGTVEDDSSARVGGLAGYSQDGTITGCYAAARMTGGSNTGAFVGYSTNSTITSAYFNKDVFTRGIGISVGGTVNIMGLNTSYMTRENAGKNMEGLDFFNTWVTKGNDEGTGYFPQLKAFTEGGEGVRTASLSGVSTSAYCKAVFNVADYEYSDSFWVLYNNAVQPPDISRPGYILDGWYTDENMTSMFDPDSTAITQDTAFYARWVAGGGATLTSRIGTVDNAGGIIADIPAGTSLADFKVAVTPAAGASFEVYEPDGITVANDLKSGYILIVTAQDSTTRTYTLTVKSLEKPAVPENLSAEAGDRQVTFKWKAVEGATSYKLYWWDTSMNEKLTEIPAQEHTDTAEGVVTYTETGLINGRVYNFSVAASNASGTSSYSSEVSATPKAAAPETPENLSAEAGDRQVTLKWKTVEGAASYKVYWWDTSMNEKLTEIPAQEHTDTAGGVVTYTETGLINGRVYNFSVAASNASGTSAYSSEVRVTPKAAAPAAPENLSAESGDGQVTLKWSAVMNAAGYRVYMGTEPGVYGSPVETADTLYTVKELANGTTYYFAVTAYSGSQESKASQEVSAVCTPQSGNGDDDENAPGITGYTVSTNHKGEADSTGTDDQYIIMDIAFDQAITITGDALSQLVIKLNGSTTQAYNGTEYSFNSLTDISAGPDGKTLHMEIHLPFAPYAGYLTIERSRNPDGTPVAITGIKNTDGTGAAWSDIALYVPNGVKFETVSQVVGDASTGTAAKVTKRVVAPETATRGMVHMLFLKNGVPVGNLDTYGANLTTHYHAYLTLNAESFAAMLPGWFNNAFGKDYTIEVEKDTVTISAKASEDGDVLDLRIYAYPQDRDTGADKSVLAGRINYAGSISPDLYAGEVYKTLKAEIDKAAAINKSIYYLQSEVDAAAGRLDALFSEYTVSFEENGGSAVHDIKQHYGTTIDVSPAPARSGYTFGGWYSDPAFTDKAEFPYMVTSDAVFYAKWTANSNGGGINTGGTVKEIPPENIPSSAGRTDEGGSTADSSEQVRVINDGKTATAVAEAEAAAGTGGRAAARVSEEQLGEAVRKALEEAEKQGTGKTAVKVEVKASEEFSLVEISIPEEAVGLMIEGGINRLTVWSPVASITLDAAALSAVYKEAGGDVKITVSRVDASALTGQAEQEAGDMPVYNLEIISGGVTIKDFGEGMAAVSLPYTPGQGEDPDKIIVFRIGDDGKLVKVTGSQYDPETGTVDFLTPHFSSYAVGYSDISFSDVSGWYGDYVDYLAARDIIKGIGPQVFAPSKNITRAELVQILANMADAELSGYTASEFSDVGSSDWYCGAVQWAYENGIVSGYGGKFSPNAYVTRQDLAVILARYAQKVAEYTLPEKASKMSFTDESLISGYAEDAVVIMQKAGIISGRSDGSFNPGGSATRAETAKMIALFIQGAVHERIIN